MTQHPRTQAKPVKLNEYAKREELTEQDLAEISGGFLAFRFKLVAVKTISWAYDD
jgi:bacteriocin-like protein